MNPIVCLVATTVALGLAVPLHAQVDCADWSTSAFFEAAEISDVTRCLQAGADLEARAEGGITPLHVAAVTGNAEAIAALAAAGAHLEARNVGGLTPLHIAITAEAIAALVDAGADLEARAESGFTPLHVAANAGTAEAIEALLHAGAHLEARNVGGLTPLHVAAVLGNAEAIEALLRAGADPKALTTAGKLPFTSSKTTNNSKEPMVTGSSTRPGLNSTQSRELILGASLSEFMGKPSY